MKSFRCRCGHTVFFENSECVACGASLGFDPASFTLVTLEPGDSRYKRCANGVDFDACNWLLPADEDHTLCRACQFNRTIPNMQRQRNRGRFRRFESAKKRLFYTFHQLGLTLQNGFSDPANGLLFDFIEDRRSDPDQYPEAFVQTGFQGGVITINAMESDDVARELARLEMNESYRTLLGHLRHESGHYFEHRCRHANGDPRSFDSLFGDPDQDYALALESYYANGPAADWTQRYISAYASAHPKEDWAECWAHYLYIYDVLETAWDNGLVARSPRRMSMDARIDDWTHLSVALNEMNRSSGLSDAYPFVVNQSVRRKLGYIDQAIASIRTGNPAPAGY